ncbi:DinB family protein [Actinocorallia populi]|uniref:DinB family protein n=1 Tax=Actinocorallia populi TaxID=2079200 RepID=UPI000D086677|nr:DinB family protein [Actinocorallia populi]
MDVEQRTERPRAADELATLAGFLEFQRDTLALKCAGLTGEQLRRKAVPPSELSLLGLVRHLAEVERGWFRNVIAGDGVRLRWGTGSPRVSGFGVEDADVEEAFAVWREECASSRAILASAESLDVTGVHRTGRVFSLRYVLTHMIEEYARHNGHADLLRECIDGVTGE